MLLDASGELLRWYLSSLFAARACVNKEAELDCEVWDQGRVLFWSPSRELCRPGSVLTVSVGAAFSGSGEVLDMRRSSIESLMQCARLIGSVGLQWHRLSNKKVTGECQHSACGLRRARCGKIRFLCGKRAPAVFPRLLTVTLLLGRFSMDLCEWLGICVFFGGVVVGLRRTWERDTPKLTQAKPVVVL